MEKMKEERVLSLNKRTEFFWSVFFFLRSLLLLSLWSFTPFFLRVRRKNLDGLEFRVSVLFFMCVFDTERTQYFFTHKKSAHTKSIVIIIVALLVVALC